MVRHYDELAEVAPGRVAGAAGSEVAPAQVLWRERLYLVREVLAHWVETTPWWQSPAVQRLRGGEVGDGAAGTTGGSGTPGATGAAGLSGPGISPGWDPLVERPVPAPGDRRVPGQRTGDDRSPRPAPADRPALGTRIDPGDREVWRVEAGAGRSAPLVVLDLAHDTATGSWRVLRCHD